VDDDGYRKPWSASYFSISCPAPDSLRRLGRPPAFPAAFPWFNPQQYWQARILELREQIALMDEPPLVA
jgi:hypothetical protein